MFDVKAIFTKQLDLVKNWHENPKEVSDLDPFLQDVYLQHYTNFKLWHQEDLARDNESDDAVIAKVKRAIDKLNQERNDLIEKLDGHVIAMLQKREIKASPDAKLNSETVGSIIDRQSINALKIYHMTEEVEREDATDEHIEKCEAKLVRLKEQRIDLEQSLLDLLADLESGDKVLKVYKQMKMYNDESLNPVLYKKK